MHINSYAYHLHCHHHNQLSVKNIGKIIQSRDSKKAYGHDNKSICMLKICGDLIYKQLEIIFWQAPLTGVFRSEWKRRKQCWRSQKKRQTKY